MLVNCAAYRNGRRVANFDKDQLRKAITDPECFVWVALQDASQPELADLQQTFQLPALAVEDALHGHQRPKVEEYDRCLFAALHVIEDGDAGDFRVGQLAIFAGPNFILSSRTGSSSGFAGVRTRAEREPELLQHGVGYVFYALADAVVDRYFPIIVQLETELEVIEGEIFSNAAPSRDIVERLYELKRKAMVLKHAVSPLLNDMGKLHGGRVPPQVLNVQDYIRDVADHLARINSSVDGLRDTIGTAVQVNLSLVTISDGEVTKRLAAWASIFAVWTSFAGVWGMNFEHMPELKWTYGYPIALGVIATACLALYMRFRSIGWLKPFKMSDYRRPVREIAKAGNSYARNSTAGAKELEDIDSPESKGSAKE